MVSMPKKKLLTHFILSEKIHCHLLLYTLTEILNSSMLKKQAYFGIHKPKDISEADLARKRLIFDEFFYLQVRL